MFVPLRKRNTTAWPASSIVAANLIRHIYEVDPLVCPRCGAAMKIIAVITEGRVIRAILDSVRPTATPFLAGSLHPAARPVRNGVH